MQKIFWALMALLPLRSLAQISDNFSDGDFTNTPGWVADNISHWTVQDGKLRSNSLTASSTFYITTPSTISTNVEWGFFINLQFNTSGANYVDVYLMSEQSDLTNPANNGYFVRIGGTTDEISLYKMMSGVPSPLINGLDGTTNASNSSVRIKVTRDGSNQWTLSRDLSGGTAFVEEGSVSDNTFSASSYFGIRVTQSTGSFHQKHFFDDIYAIDPSVDSEAPEVVSTTIISPNQLEVEFSENIDESTAEELTNFTLNTTEDAITAEVQPDSKTVLLSFATTFPNADTSRLLIRNVEDLAGNVMEETEEVFFFFEAVAAENHDLIFTEIFADPTPSFGLPEAEYVEIYNRSNKIFNLANWTYKDATTAKTLSQKFLRPGEYIVLVNSSSSALFAAYDNVISISSFPALTNTGEPITLRDNTGLLIDSVFYDDDWHTNEETKGGGHSLERINYENFCLDPVDNWTTSSNSVGGTPGLINAIFNDTPETQGPALLTTIAESSIQVVLHFDEKLNEVVPAVSSFEITPSVEIQSVEFIDLENIRLIVEPLVPSATYSIQLNSIFDCTGNEIEPTSVEFVLPEQAQHHDVIITEIFADPSPVIGLPETEFVELFNRSDKVINLGSFLLFDGSTHGVLPEVVLYPQQYLVLTTPQAVFESVVGVINFPSLNNAGESIVLTNPEGVVIDSIHYTLAWYHDEDKQQGGWSLERRDLNNFCLESENWLASTNAQGGTPGIQNSVFTTEADAVGPELISVTVQPSTEITLHFNEKLNATLPTLTDVVIDPSINIDHISLGETDHEIVVQLSSTIEQGIVYTVTVLNSMDCTGNVTGETRSIVFGFPIAADFHDIVFSEIMADPSPSVGLPETEYVELHNRTNKWIDLTGWKISDATGTATLPAVTMLPNSFIALISSSGATVMDSINGVVHMPHLISLHNTGELLTLSDSLNRVIDSIRYSTSWLEEAKRDGGWSLERVDPDDFCTEDRHNWKVSASPNGGTPGVSNSIDGYIIDTTAPSLVSLEIENDQSLLAIVDEKIANTQQPDFFEINPPLNIQSAQMISDYQIVITLDETPAPSIVYTVAFSGLADCAGNEINTIATVVVTAEAEQNDILISEIMVDPSPSVGLPEEEFIELINRSNKYINTSDLKVSDGGTEIHMPSFVLAPGQYVVLSPHASTLQQYGTVIQMNLPSLTNSGRSIWLVNNNGLLIDSIRYDVSWYHDENKQQGGWSLERRDLNNFCLESENWLASTNALGGTPGTQNSVFTIEADTTGPELVSATVLSSTEITLHFNEKLNSVLPMPADIIIHPTTSIDEVYEGENDNDLVVRLLSEIVDGVVYEVTVINSMDCTGNARDITQPVLFGNPVTADFHDIVFSEIMADPSPSAGLPEAEYIELYNRTNKWIDLTGWKISDATDTATLPTISILPNSFVTLISSSGASAADSLNNAVRVSNFISLHNAGEPLKLFDSSYRAIDSLRYSTSWLEEDKREGGWSLERINPDDFCTEDHDNWKVTVSALGGTPGGTNSINGHVEDTTAPDLISITIQDDQSLLAIIDEKIANPIQPNYFEIIPSLGVQSAERISGKEIIIVPTEAPIASVIYTVHFSGLMDCAGNEMDTTAVAVVTEEAEQNDILITEIMADPSPSVGLPEEEFIELVNRSDKYINLDNLKVSDGITEVPLPSFVLAPGQYVVLSSRASAFQQYGAVIQVSLPSLTNSGKSVRLANESGVRIDSICYDLNWYRDENKQQGGWSLERRDLENFCIEDKNWIASESETGGTPGQQNSVFTTQADMEAPLLQTVTIISETEIVLHFDEKLSQFLPLPSNYSIEPAVNVNAAELSSSLRDITLIINEPLISGVVYRIYVQGIADCIGNTGTTDVIHFGIPVRGFKSDVVISEIMPDPSPVVGLPEAEYIELYNRTDHWLDLDGWKICDATDTAELSKVSIQPHSFIVLIGSSATSYVDTLSTVKRIPAFLSLSNLGEEITLINDLYEEIDKINYSQLWLSQTKRDGGWSLERIDPDDFCAEKSKNWSESESVTGGTPGEVNSVDGEVWDYNSPVITLSEIRDSSIFLTFNEKITDTLSADLFTIEPLNGISEAVFTDALNRQVQLRFSFPFTRSTSHRIRIKDLHDCSGNAVDTTFFFVRTEKPGPRDIIISEIMADPTPVVGLSDEEYIELFNRSYKYINLNEVLISDGTTLTSIQPYVLAPDQYVVVAVHNDFDTVKNVVQANFPSLTNSGKKLFLRSLSGEVIDSLHYAVSWYQDENKQQGGWSMERRDLNNFCLESENWVASTDEQGGTPGRQNSVFTEQGDTLSPRLLDAVAISPVSIELHFNEKLEEFLPLAEWFQITPHVNITDVTRTADKRTIVLSIENEIQPGIVYEVEVTNIEDCSGNRIDTVMNHTAFGIPEAAQLHDVIINEIMSDPSPVVGLPEAEYIEIYNRTNKLLDVSDWKFIGGNDTSSFSFSRLLPYEYKVICHTTHVTHLKDFRAVGLPNFSAINNTSELLIISNKSDTVIDSVRFSNAWHDSEKKDGGWSLERIYDDNFCDATAENWRSSQSSIGGTPASANSMEALTEDDTAPQLLSVQLMDSSEVIFTFSEKVASDIDADHLIISPSVEIESIQVRDPERTSMIASFAGNFQAGVTYHISIAELSDCFENVRHQSDTIAFLLPEQAEPQDIIITEILADPSPVVGLPEVEFVELFNRSNKVIDLKNLTFSDGTATVQLPSHLIIPEEYVTLTRQANLFANSIVVNQFPTLSNSGEQLKIKNTQGRVLDSVNFSSLWYKDEEKAAGGWSLERVDLNSVCVEEEENWRASVHITGGTPGFRNSVFSVQGDTVKPALSGITVLSDTVAILSFSKKLSDNLLLPENFIGESLTVREASFVNPSKKQIQLVLSSPLQEGELYSLIITEITDCSGNVSQNVTSLPFGIAAKTTYKDVIITEIMADPSPPLGLPEAEYIELHNRSGRLVDLKNWKVAGKNIGAGHLLPEEYIILCSAASVNALSTFGRTHFISGFPLLTNTGTSIVLRNEQNELIDSIAYTDSWYKDSEKAEGGWSLELIDRDNTCSEEQNWMSSESEDGGTPGQQNSVDGDKPDLTGPKLTSIIPTTSKLTVEFDEKLDEQINGFLFELEPHLEVVSKVFADNSLRQIELQLSSELIEGTLYKLTAEVNDCAGNPVQQDNSIIFALPQEAQPGDILLNEILFNPRPYGSDFVELYNASTKFINLKNWSLANVENGIEENAIPIATSDVLLHPHSFLAITPDIANIQTEYPQSTGRPFLQAELPPLLDEAGSVALIKPDTTIYDQVMYTEAMHSSLLKEREGVSLERISGSEWRSGVVTTNFATPGYLNANALPTPATTEEVVVEPEVFEPVTGQPDFASIHYQFEKPGFVANARVLDAYGRVVKDIANNELLADRGFFTWDGDHNDGSLARIGYYTFWLEVFDTSGIVKTFRKRIVIAYRL